MYPDQDYREELWLMNADGSDQTYVGIEGFAARWSPDGSRFIYTSKSTGNYDIYTCQINGTDILQLTETEGEEYFPAFSPDGNYIAFGASSDGSYGGREIFVMTVEGTELLRLTENSVFDNYPRWSPDGSLISFSSDLSAHQHWEVYLINADGANLQRVTYTSTDATAINPVWRPQ